MSEISINNLLGGDLKNRLYEKDMFNRGIETGSGKNRPEELKKTCVDLEALFVSQLLKEMRDTVPKSGLMDGGQAEEIYTSLLDSHLSREIASNGSLEFAKKLYEQLSKICDTPQGKSDGQTSSVNKGV